MTPSFADIDSQHVELLPGRTVMSTFILGGHGGPKIVDTNNIVSCGVSIGGLNIAIGLLGSGVATSSGADCSGL
jgi:hypothetical protein